MTLTRLAHTFRRWYSLFFVCTLSALWCIVCLFSTQYIHAQEAGEAPPGSQFVPLVPDLPFVGTGAFTDGGITQLLNGLFGITIGAAAALAVIMFSIGGFRYMLSEAIPAKGSAVSQMRDAILGLGIILASVIILQTINPNIVSLQLFDPAISEVATGGVREIPQEAGAVTAQPYTIQKFCTPLTVCQCAAVHNFSPLLSSSEVRRTSTTVVLGCVYDASQRGGPQPGDDDDDDTTPPPPPPPPPPDDDDDEPADDDDDGGAPPPPPPPPPPA